MRPFHTLRNHPLLFLSLAAALALPGCEPGKALDTTSPEPPTDTVAVDSGFVALITVVSAPSTVLPLDTALVELAVTDSASGNPLKGAKLSVTSTQFAILSASAVKAFDIDSLPDDGKVTFRIVSSAPGNGSINVRVTSGIKIRSKSVAVLVTEKPVAPKVLDKLPNKVAVKETTLVAFTVVDSLQERPLSNAEVTISSALYTILDPVIADTVSVDTTGSDGKASFRVYAPGNGGGAGTLTLKVKTAAGVVRTVTYTLATYEDSAQDRPRKMVFTALRSSLRADGTDSTELRVLVKDDNNNPLAGEKIRFTATGGVVRAEATTDAWGMTSTILRSERVNKTVVVTATLEKTGATAQQSVSFDGVNILISPNQHILMNNTPDEVIFELRDGGNTPISGDTLEILARGASKGFAGTGKDSLLVITDTKGQYRTTINSSNGERIILIARALGAKSEDTVKYTNNVLSLASSKSSINGDGKDEATLTVTLKKVDNAAIDQADIKWTTTFGTFKTTPFTRTDATGKSSIVLRSPNGSGLAIVNVEARKDGELVASGSMTVQVKALKVARLTMKVSPDNIAVKVGETKLTATAFDSAGNYMTGVLVGFRMIKGAGGGDEKISPPVDYTQAGQAEAVFKAGGVISLYRGVKLAAVALEVSGGDTLVVASSDTVGLTISGPPHRISVGVNILKGENPNDGTFALPTAAVVTDVNGNLVADGTPVNFSTTPISARYLGKSWVGTNESPYYAIVDSVWYSLPWTDYNNNGKLDAGEPASRYNKNNPSRGEDRDGNGVILAGPEPFIDYNENGVWDGAFAEPTVPSPSTDTTGRVFFVDWNRNGRQDTAEPFTDYNNDGECQCAGQLSDDGQLYEATFFGSAPNHPFPGEASIGIPRQIVTSEGKAATKITYVQSMALVVEVRITAESNGITSTVDAILPIVKDDE